MIREGLVSTGYKWLQPRGGIILKPSPSLPGGVSSAGPGGGWGCGSGDGGAWWLPGALTLALADEAAATRCLAFEAPGLNLTTGGRGGPSGEGGGVLCVRLTYGPGPDPSISWAILYSRKRGDTRRSLMSILTIACRHSELSSTQRASFHGSPSIKAASKTHA
jgi:hypothetical protein